MNVLYHCYTYHIGVHFEFTILVGNLSSFKFSVDAKLLTILLRAIDT